MRAPSRSAIRSTAAVAAMAAVVLLVTATAAFAATAHFSKGRYAGTTSQGKSLTMQLSSANRVRTLTFGYTTTCDSGAHFTDKPTIHHATFTGRRFKGTVSYDNTNISGYLIHVTMHVGGKPTARGAKGSLSVTAVVDSADTGQQVDTCRSGSVSWTAKRK